MPFEGDRVTRHQSYSFRSCGYSLNLQICQRTDSNTSLTTDWLQLASQEWRFWQTPSHPDEVYLRFLMIIKLAHEMILCWRQCTPTKLSNWIWRHFHFSLIVNFSTNFFFNKPLRFLHCNCLVTSIRVLEYFALHLKL